mmetsp:Transcript_8150/g.9822  ORF Transcript_8150/g.9822 Transcript_8150/m.9822 type:complete len:131 (-) Transcript_8150:103-495(-)
MYVKANVHVRNIVGVVFLSDLPGAQASVSNKQVEVLTNFRVEGLAALPLKVPTSDDIKQELIPKQRKPRKSNSGATPKKAKENTSQKENNKPKPSSALKAKRLPLEQKGSIEKKAVPPKKRKIQLTLLSK